MPTVAYEALNRSDSVDPLPSPNWLNHRRLPSSQLLLASSIGPQVYDGPASYDSSCNLIIRNNPPVRQVRCGRLRLALDLGFEFVDALQRSGRLCVRVRQWLAWRAPAAGGSPEAKWIKDAITGSDDDEDARYAAPIGSRQYLLVCWMYYPPGNGYRVGEFPFDRRDASWGARPRLLVVVAVVAVRDDQCAAAAAAAGWRAALAWFGRRASRRGRSRRR
jgi:hypothetical protein